MSDPLRWLAVAFLPWSLTTSPAPAMPNAHLAASGGLRAITGGGSRSPSPGIGQHDASLDRVAREIARLDSLRMVRRAAYDSLAHTLMNRVDWVDVNVGLFHLRTTAALRDRVRAAGVLATRAVGARGGDALRDRLGRRQPVIGTDSLAIRLGTEWVVWFAADTGRVGWDRRAVATGSASASQIADHLVNFAERVALEGADSTLGAWLMVQTVPLQAAARADWMRVFTEVGTVRSAVMRRCRAGDAGSCLTALGVRSPEGNRLTTWYDPSDYRALLRLVGVRADDSAGVVAAARCQRTGEADACVTAARAISQTPVPLPASALARRLFLDDVLRAGGSDAYARLMAARGSIEERLTAAAGMPLERVVGPWRDHVAAARPDAASISASTAFFTLAWCGVFLAFAVVRRGSWI
jgi:hypothetical protein